MGAALMGSEAQTNQGLIVTTLVQAIQNHASQNTLRALIKQKPSATQLDAEIKKVATSHQSWYINAHFNSKQIFYSVVTDAYALYWFATSANVDQAVRDAIWQAIERALKANSIQFKPDERGPAMVLKATFGFGNRQRVSNCTKVFSLARKEKIEPEAFHAWLIASGGIEKIRLSNTSSAPTSTATDSAEVGRTKLPTHPLQTFKPDRLPLGSDDLNNNVLLIAKYDDKGQLGIYAVVRKQAALNAAYAAFGKDGE